MNSVSEAGRYRRAARQMGARPADTEKRRGLDRGQVSRGRKHLGSDHRRKVVCRSPRSGPIYRGPSGRRRACARAPRLSRPCDLTRSHRGRTGKQLRVLGVTGGVGRLPRDCTGTFSLCRDQGGLGAQAGNSQTARPSTNLGFRPWRSGTGIAGGAACFRGSRPLARLRPLTRSPISVIRPHLAHARQVVVIDTPTRRVFRYAEHDQGS